MSFLKTLFGAGSAYSDNISVLSTSEFREAISKGKPQLVDVRTTNEYKAGHIKGAKHIDFFKQADFATRFEKFDKTKPMYIYCKSGGRSGQAAKKLAQMGFEEIYDLQGGYMRWR